MIAHISHHVNRNRHRLHNYFLGDLLHYEVVYEARLDIEDVLLGRALGGDAQHESIEQGVAVHRGALVGGGVAVEGAVDLAKVVSAAAQCDCRGPTRARDTNTLWSAEGALQKFLDVAKGL